MRVVAALSVSFAVLSASAQAPNAAATKASPPKAKTEAAKSVTGKIDTSALLNKASRQPMLAERITKSFSLVGQGVLETRSRRQLEDGLREFEDALNALLKDAPTAEIKENYALLAQLFDEYRGIKARPVNLENAKELAEQNEEVVWISQKGAMLLQQHIKSTRGELIATAGDVRTLTQRIAKLYLFRSWGVRSDVIANDLKNAETDYRAAIKKLLDAKENTAQIKNELALAETQWLFLKQAIERLDAAKTSKTELEHVSKSCDNILEVMERVTKLYEGMKA
jgi:hypothetical protein